MELCETCKKTKCNKSIVTIQEKDMTTIKCVEYEKDEEKVKGYVRPKEKTARPQRTVMGLYSPSWN